MNSEGAFDKVAVSFAENFWCVIEARDEFEKQVFDFLQTLLLRMGLSSEWEWWGDSNEWPPLKKDLVTLDQAREMGTYFTDATARVFRTKSSSGKKLFYALVGVGQVPPFKDLRFLTGIECSDDDVVDLARFLESFTAQNKSLALVPCPQGGSSALHASTPLAGLSMDAACEQVRAFLDVWKAFDLAQAKRFPSKKK